MYHNEKKGPKRGVALYSYSAEFGFEKTLEDCFEDVYDMGAHGIEILANIHIENYPYPTQEWVEHWFALLNKYDLEPVEYGHRTRGGKGFVKGKHMMAISLEEVSARLPAYLQEWLNDFISTHDL